MDDDAAPETAVDWRSWGTAAFEEARDADRPVLLSLSAPWCGWCHRMDEATYADPDVAAAVESGFVPVRVDADRRPRVRERYAVGGFPSTVFLTPDGLVLSGAGYLEADGLSQVLDRVAEAYAERGGAAGRVPRAARQDEPPVGEVTEGVEAAMVERLEEQYDDGHAGWGTEGKFPLPRAVEFALKRDRNRALVVLDAVVRELQDDDGGFFRYATARDWSEPAREKLLDANAGVLRAAANAYLYTGSEDYREAVEDCIDYLAGTLWTGEAFGGSQAPAPGDPSGAGVADPPVDATAFADRNAAAAEALLTYAAYTDDDRARRYGERTLSFLETLVDDGRVAHFEGAPDACRSLLADHAAVAGAFATAAQVLGGDHLDTARVVADAAVDDLHEGPSFVDGPAVGEGLLDRPLRPIDGNAAMANALVDLHALTGAERYREVARDAVSAFAGAADRLNVQVAGYATAAARVRDPPLRVDVAAAPGSDLHRAALRVADHEKVVVPSASGYESGTAHVVAGGDDAGPARTPEELVDLVASAVDR